MDKCLFFLRPENSFTIYLCFKVFILFVHRWGWKKVKKEILYYIKMFCFRFRENIVLV